MNFFLIMAYLFFLGSVIGWVIELLFRNLVHKSKNWINPGFCTGPYLPIYGFGLCTLYLLASLEELHLVADPVWNKVVLFAAMALGMTAIEYIAGVFCLKFFKVRLWDYSGLWGNIQGIICPIFSLAWAALGAVYYFLVHPYILEGLAWLSRNLAFSFFIGVFFGVFLVDVANSAQIVMKLKAFAEENRVVLAFEEIKTHLRDKRLEAKHKYLFFAPFRTERPLREHLKELLATLEEQRKERKR